MSRTYSLAYLGANGAGPEEAIAIAAEAGYDMLSFRLLPASPGEVLPPWLEDAGFARRVTEAMHAAGLGFLDAEMIRIPDGGAETGRYLPFVERIAAMGARHINVVFDDADRGRQIDCFGRICEMAAEHGLTADLEFMPWTGVRTLGDARAVIEAAGHPAGAILFDCLHFDRCGSALDEISALPPGMVNYVQVCDGPAEWENTDADLVRVARTARLVPGKGGIDLDAILSRLPGGLAISVEVPNVEEAARLGRVALARAALEASRPLVGAVDARAGRE